MSANNRREGITMNLDERKKKILKTIIRTYLATGEPVGSRTISKDPEMSVSSATIRNEMVDLEEMGYIAQPHTSAGRIPTDKGYRFYVDELMAENDQKIIDMRNFMEDRLERVETVLKRMADMISQKTRYTTLIAGPDYSEGALKLIQLSRLDSRHLVAVIVLETNEVRNKVIDVDVPYTDEDLLRLNVLLNSALQGKSLDDLTISFVRRLREQSGEYGPVISKVLEAATEMIEQSSDEKPEVYTSGTTNIFRYPELAESQMASEILRNIENKEEFFERLGENTQDAQKNPIQVYIGQETAMRGMQNCSVVTANYEFGNGLRGVIGIVGPKRMDYENVVGTLQTVLDQLDSVYHKNEN